MTCGVSSLWEMGICCLEGAILKRMQLPLGTVGFKRESAGI
jgi:hypothetical protein